MKDTARLSVVIVVVFVAHVCVAADRYFVPPQTLPAGADGQRIELRCDNDVELFAYSFGVTYDPTVLSVNAVSTQGTVAEDAFVVERIDPGAGTVGYAVVLMLDPNSVFVDQAVPPGQNRVMAFLDVDVSASTDLLTTIAFADVELNPLIPQLQVNVMTDDSGFSTIPDLVDGEITIEDRTPRILSVANNSGLSGHVFQVVGQFLEEPGLEVTLCGSIAAAVLRSDGQTLDVTAPSCGQLGPAELQVCTERGCDTLPEGFTYEESPASPTITGFLDNTGQEGTEFTIVGTEFDRGDLSVSVCGGGASIVSVTGDGTMIVATAPNCDALGPAEVLVCTVFGCASDPAGFFYEFAGPRFTRGDCNGDSVVSGITDAIFMLGFLFGSGQEWPCFASCDFNDDLTFDVSDAVFLLSAEFAGGPAPPAPTRCGPGAEGSFLFGCEKPPGECN